MDKIVIIGYGGIGSILLRELVIQYPQVEITIYDGDVVEEKNLLRQEFTHSDIGRQKVESADKYPQVKRVVSDYFNRRTRIHPEAVVFCCVDNNKSRRIIAELDNFTIYMSNNVNDSNAWVHLDGIQENAFIKKENDGWIKQVHCNDNEEIIEQTRLSNATAVMFGLQLYKFYQDFDMFRLYKEKNPIAPILLRNNGVAMETLRIGDLK